MNYNVIYVVVLKYSLTAKGYKTKIIFLNFQFLLDR